MTKINVLKCALATLVVALPLSAPWQGATRHFSAKIERTLVTSDTDEQGNLRFGGCMVHLSVSPSEQGLNCPLGRWVSFSCGGDYTSRSNAMRLLDSAQLAFVSDREVLIWVDDTRKHNGWCFASRVDVLSG